MISDYLDISVKTVEGHITRAFKFLMKRLEGRQDAYLFILFGLKGLVGNPKTNYSTYN
ncbi:hypothetical protein GCM10022395_25240 [Snuella lapsa]|uniref:HTH luxR-type domain-containing protein n=1 Tax=Snuella lapsa TaxID=870481 RepID=A0ABP6Y125_9FLAO